MITLKCVLLFLQEHMYLGNGWGGGHFFLKEYLLKYDLHSFCTHWPHIFSYIKKMLLSRRLNSVLIFCLDVALKDSFPLADQFNNVINLSVTQMANTVCNPFSFF